MTILTCAVVLSLSTARVDATRANAALAFVEQAAKATGAEAAPLRDRLRTERADLARAFDWFVDAGQAKEAARFVTAINPFLHSREARDWFARTLAMPAVQSDPQVRMPLLATGSFVAFHVGDQDHARRWAQDLLDTARAAGDRARTGTGYFRLSQIELRNGNLSGFHRLNDAMLVFCRETQDEAAQRCELNVRNMRGEAARVEENYPLAAEMNEANLAYGREHGRPTAVLTATLNLAFIDVARGATAGVRERLLDAITRMRTASDRSLSTIGPGEREGLAVLVAALGMLAEREGRPETAARLLGIAAAELDRLGRLPDPADQVQIALSTGRVRKILGSSAFGKAFAAGKKQGLDEVMAELAGS